MGDRGQAAGHSWNILVARVLDAIDPFTGLTRKTIPPPGCEPQLGHGPSTSSFVNGELQSGQTFVSRRTSLANTAPFDTPLKLSRRQLKSGASRHKPTGSQVNLTLFPEPPVCALVLKAVGHVMLY